MAIKGWLKRSGETVFQVGAEDYDDPEHKYSGPTADVFVDNKFFYICTDSYEGYAMLNVEALPFLIEALTELQRKVGITQSAAEAAVRAVVQKTTA